jgi:hypothetical protein
MKNKLIKVDKDNNYYENCISIFLFTLFMNAKFYGGHILKDQTLIDWIKKLKVIN